jgi:hypothetical protein
MFSYTWLSGWLVPVSATATKRACYFLDGLHCRLQACFTVCARTLFVVCAVEMLRPDQQASFRLVLQHRLWFCGGTWFCYACVYKAFLWSNMSEFAVAM